MNLFEIDYGVDQSPPDDTEINQVMIFYSQDELTLFKKYCKELMRREWPADFFKKGNISDLVLKILKKEYESNNPAA